MKTRFLLVLLFFPTILLAQVNVTEDENYFWQKRELFKEIIWGLISEGMDTTGCVEDSTRKDKIFIQWSQDSTGAIIDVQMSVFCSCDIKRESILRKKEEIYKAILSLPPSDIYYEEFYLWGSKEHLFSVNNKVGFTFSYIVP